MNSDPINWKRLRTIFGNPNLVAQVTEQQFDYNDEKLREMGRTPHDEIDPGDLWYYHHDLAYVELQAELFAHLFPVCLMDWHRTLLANEPCSHGDSEFHYGIIRGNVMEKMLTTEQRNQVAQVFRESMLYRLDQERGFEYDRMKVTACGWMGRLNSLGLFSESLPSIWQAWWEVETPGRAVCLLQYCSGLMYFDGENPIFEKWTCERGGGGPHLWENDAEVYDRGWSLENVRFLREFVTTERVIRAIQNAALCLERDPESEQAARIAADIDDRIELIDSRVSELPDLLFSSQSVGWSV